MPIELKIVFFFLFCGILGCIVYLIRSQKKLFSEKRIRGRALSKVKKGQLIKINISGYINDAYVINNCPADKKMFVRKIFHSGNTESVIEYDDYAFINFTTLNNEAGHVKYDLKEDLKSQLEAAVREDRFEEAVILRDAINQLNKMPENK